MSCGQNICAEITCCVEEIFELDVLVARDTRDRRFACHIRFGEGIDHLVFEAAFIVEHIMGNAQTRSDIARIMNILSRAAGTFAMNGFAMIIKLQGHADDIIAVALEQRGHDRGIDTARHSNDHARLRRGLVEAQRIGTLHRGGAGNSGFWLEQRVHEPMINHWRGKNATDWIKEVGGMRSRQPQPATCARWERNGL